MKKRYLTAAFAIACTLSSCTSPKKNNGSKASTTLGAVPTIQTVHSWLADKNASNETAALFYNLKKSAKTQVMFGHMEDNKNGYDGWKNAPGRSDVYEVTGAHPVVYGFDFGGIASFRAYNANNKETQVTHDRVMEAYKRNGVATFSWHYGNPVSKGSFNWKQSPVNAVSEILPNGSYNNVFRQSLVNIALFAASVKQGRKLVPIIFRPFHEFDGDWFWWGKTHCTTTEYKELYRYTVTYLRDSLHVKNLLYAWSPDCRFDSRETYTERYPGNDYVDIVGMDNYHDLRQGQTPTKAAAKLKIVSDFAIAENKVAAFTETGLENLTQADWYTNTLLKVLKAQQTQVAYVMVWSNRPNSYWTPYKGHPAEADFIAFKNDAYMLFGDKVGKLYKMPR